VRRVPVRKAKRNPDISQRWSLDFVSDTFGASRKFRMLADTSISGAREQGALVRVYITSDCIVSDKRTAFTSRAILKWVGESDMDWHCVDPRSRQQKAVIKSCAGSLRLFRRVECFCQNTQPEPMRAHRGLGWPTVSLGVLSRGYENGSALSAFPNVSQGRSCPEKFRSPKDKVIIRDGKTVHFKPAKSC
jgi:hypothetical protein